MFNISFIVTQIKSGYETHLLTATSRRWSQEFSLSHLLFFSEKTKNLLFNGTKAVMGRIWKADGEEKLTDVSVSDVMSVSSASAHQTLLKGQTLIGTDGRLKKANSVPGQ